jgi:hypothetical protein
VRIRRKSFSLGSGKHECFLNLTWDHRSASLRANPRRSKTTIWMERLSEVLSTMHSQVNMAAICIQKFVSSRVSASHDTCRTLLRPSSITKPRYPLLSVVSNGWRAASPTLCVAQPPTSLILKPKRDTGPMRRRPANRFEAAAVLGGFPTFYKVWIRKKY